LQKIIVQSELCDGCLDCEKACCGLYGTSRINIKELEGSYYPIICQQCEDAPCALICPTEAMSSDGVEDEKCIACGLCMMVCPFGAVKVENKVAQKCDRCESRGESPACIKACSKRAISLIDTDEIKAKKQEQFLSKMAGISKKPKKSNFINLVTSGTRANTSYKKK
jgi:carbon-monoxide dehydrogenase iron sulfur subunit